MLQKELDLSSFDSQTNFSGPQCRKQKEIYDDKGAPRTITRCSRISFECHADLLLEDLIDDINVVESEEEDTSFDTFLTFLKKASRFDNLDSFDDL